MVRKIQKKGMGTEDALMFFCKLIIITVAMFVFVMFTKLLLDPFPDITEGKAEILLGRVLYSDSINYVDSANEVHTTILDLDKLNSQSDLEKYFHDEFLVISDSTVFTFKLEVEFEQNGKEDNLIFYSDEVKYLITQPLANKEGKGSAYEIYRAFPKKCKLNSEIIPCFTKFSLIIDR